jgi:hypothetical protein
VLTLRPIQKQNRNTILSSAIAFLEKPLMGNWCLLRPSVPDLHRAVYDLVAHCYSRDLGRAMQIGGWIKGRIIGTSRDLISNLPASFGGLRQNRLGRDGAIHGALKITGRNVTP